MRNYIKAFLIILFSIVFFYNFSFADIVPLDIEPTSPESVKIEEKNPGNKILEININENNLKYEIGFYNTISTSYQIFDIKLNFQDNFQWELNIYEPISYNSNKTKLYKSFQINWKESVFQFKSKSDLSFFVKDRLGNEKELKWISYQHSNSIYLLNDMSNCSSSYICTDNLNYSILSLLSYPNIIVNKDITESEKKILLEYVYKWWQIVLNKFHFSKYFQDIIINELWKKEKSEIYYYGLGTFQIKGKYGDKETWDWGYYDNQEYYPEYIDNSLLKDNALQAILIDDTIKWKYLDYRIILIFVCLYFIIIIPINFLIKKKKWNKLFFIYSIPMISVTFIILLIIMNIVVKWIYNIENKVEINIIKDGKVYQQIYNLDFTPNGGDYQTLIDSDDVIMSSLNQYYNRYNNDRERDIKDNKLSFNFENIKSSQIIGFKYGRLKEYNENDFHINYDKTYDNRGDFAKDYIDFEKNKDTYYRWNYDTIMWQSGSKRELYQMKKIWINKILDEKYSNKYSLGWKKRYKLRVDIYY